jgi:ABC-type phosphate/phosphonate transport system ATPase subunit
VIGLQDGAKMFEGRPGELDARALQEIYAMEVL